MKFGTFLLAMMQPLIARILTVLGFSVVSIVGMTAVVDQLKTSIVSGVTGLPADMGNFFLLCGGGVGIGIIFGAVATRMLLWQIKNATHILGKNPG
jgi:hypothetical protein